MKTSYKAALVAVLLTLGFTLLFFWGFKSPAVSDLEAKVAALNNQLSQHYVLYCEAFGKNYNSKEEFERRKGIFIENLHSICSANHEASGACKLFATNTTAPSDQESFE